MIRLIVMRHANSPPLDGPVDDHGRPLGPRAYREIPEIARQIADRGWLPRTALVSDARRTKETWELLSGALGIPIAASFDRALYGYGAANVAANRLATLQDFGITIVMGHNPECERLIGWLSGQPVAMGTANAALLQGDHPGWPEAMRPGALGLVEVLRPGA